MMERFKTMSPDEQKQFVERMKERGGDTSAFEKEMGGSSAAKKSPAASSGATTIDADSSGDHWEDSPAACTGIEAKANRVP